MIPIFLSAFTPQTTLGTIHTLLASVALILGGLIFLRAKGTSPHRLIGRIYAVSMIISRCKTTLQGSLAISLMK